MVVAGINRDSAARNPAARNVAKPTDSAHPEDTTTVQRREKAKPSRPCAQCATPAPRLYRVSTDHGSTWSLVCDTCWPAAKATGDPYRYGGTWTSRKRA